MRFIVIRFNFNHLVDSVIHKEFVRVFLFNEEFLFDIIILLVKLIVIFVSRILFVGSRLFLVCLL